MKVLCVCVCVWVWGKVIHLRHCVNVFTHTERTGSYLGATGDRPYQSVNPPDHHYDFAADPSKKSSPYQQPGGVDSAYSMATGVARQPAD